MDKENVEFIYNKILSRKKEKETLFFVVVANPFATAWVKLEGILLSEMSHREKNNHRISLIH